jgi:hypothetical protein
MKKIFIILFILSNANAEVIPPKSDLDAVMQRVVKDFNSQMSGFKTDKFNTSVKYVTYDATPPLFTYIYTSSALSILNQKSLNQAQVTALNQDSIKKTCTDKVKVFMQHYNLKVAHVMEDSKTEVKFYAYTVSAKDCKL